MHDKQHSRLFSEIVMRSSALNILLVLSMFDQANIIWFFIQVNCLAFINTVVCYSSLSIAERGFGY